MSEKTGNKGGAPEGNTNAVRHGGRSNRHGLAVAKLGKRMAGAYIDAARLRRAIEKAVEEKHGSLSLLQLGKIQTAIRHELSCRASETAIRDNPSMPPDQIRQHREYICRWSRERDKLLTELLGDDHQAGGSSDDDPWAVVDQQAAERVRAAQRADRATGEDSGNQDSSNATGDEPGGSNVEAGSAEQGEPGDESAADHLADVASGGEVGEVSTIAPMSPNPGGGEV